MSDVVQADPTKLPEDPLSPGDLIQLDPELSESGWGPLICIVDEVRKWGVVCYWLQATERGKPPGVCYLRVPNEAFVRVGRAEWTVQSEDALAP